MVVEEASPGAPVDDDEKKRDDAPTTHPLLMSSSSETTAGAAAASASAAFSSTSPAALHPPDLDLGADGMRSDDRAFFSADGEQSVAALRAMDAHAVTLPDVQVAVALPWEQVVALYWRWSSTEIRARRSAPVVASEAVSTLALAETVRLVRRWSAPDATSSSLGATYAVRSLRALPVRMPLLVRKLVNRGRSAGAGVASVLSTSRRMMSLDGEGEEEEEEDEEEEEENDEEREEEEEEEEVEHKERHVRRSAPRAAASAAAAAASAPTVEASASVLDLVERSVQRDEARELRVHVYNHALHEVVRALDVMLIVPHPFDPSSTLVTHSLTVAATDGVGSRRDGVRRWASTHLAAAVHTAAESFAAFVDRHGAQ